MEYRRTAVIKLDTPEGVDPLLRETVEQFKHCANTASEWCWHGDDGYHVTSKANAEQALYDQLRDETDLTANLVQKGIRRAVEAVKSGVERLKRQTLILMSSNALHSVEGCGRSAASRPISPSFLNTTSPTVHTA